MPAHFGYLDELLGGDNAGTPAAADPVPDGSPLVRLGRATRGAWPELVRGADLRRQAAGHRRRRLALAASAAHSVDRAPRLRDRLPGRAGRRHDRVPDHRDFRLHRRAAVAAVRRRDLHRRHRGHRRAARARRAADGDHGRRPHRQRLRGRARRDETERRGRCARVDGRQPVRGAGAAAHPGAGDRAAAAHRRRRLHGAARRRAC